MLRIVAKRTRYCDRFRNFRMNKVSVAAFSAAVNETRAFKLVDKFSHFLRHEITVGYFVANYLCQRLGITTGTSGFTRVPSGACRVRRTPGISNS